MKIVTYNMHGKKETRWTEMIRQYDPDIILAQETYDKGIPEPRLWRKVKDSGGWGTAIYSKTGAITALTIPQCEGWVVGAALTGQSWSTPDGQPLSVFNIHATPDSEFGKGYVKAINGALKALASYQKRNPATSLIIGGDFNLKTIGFNYAEQSEREREDEAAIITSLERDFGLVSAWTLSHPGEKLPPTLLWGRDPVTQKSLEFHCDFIFVPAAWRDRILSCDILTKQECADQSDHSPVLAAFR